VRQAERIQQEIGALECRVWRQDKELSGMLRLGPVIREET
jgi:hypothetical protein